VIYSLHRLAVRARIGLIVRYLKDDGGEQIDVLEVNGLSRFNVELLDVEVSPGNF
jgi:hypothetical protein